MNLILSALAVVLLVFIFPDFIRRHRTGLYALSYVLFFGIVVYALSDVRYVLYENFETLAALFERLFVKGTLPTAIFVAVMFAGALGPRHILGKRLISVRTELSIIGSVLIGAHVVVYTVGFIRNPMLEPLELMLLCTALLSYALVLPLWATSYITVRRRIRPDHWKRLQRLAYVVYFLMFLHGFLIHAFISGSLLDLCAYFAVFGMYLALRIRKCFGDMEVLQK